MAAVVFEGKKFADGLSLKLEKRAFRLKERLGRNPKICSLVMGNDEASAVYLKAKAKAGEKMGIDFEVVRTETEAELKLLIQNLNSSEEVDGVMVQLPLVRGDGSVVVGENRTATLDGIARVKDVDCMTSGNLEELRAKGKGLMPATVRAVMTVLIEAERVLEHKGMAVVVVGGEGGVGRPLAWVLARGGYKLTSMDKHDFDAGLISKAEVVVSCTGSSGLIGGEMVREGVVAIDVGFPRGDFEFESVIAKASFITPVPGGVGPVTVACLFWNLIELVE